MAQFGLNAFEGVRCYWNEGKGILYAFRLREHLRRLTQSCRLIRLPAPYSEEEIEIFIKNSIIANGFHGDTALRITIFADGEGSWHSHEAVSMFIAPMLKSRTPLDKVPTLSAGISSWQRIDDNTLPPRAKIGANYINSRYAQLQARQDGYDVPIFLGADGKIAEGAGACIFIIISGRIVTPLTTSSILESITRNTIVLLAIEKGFVVEERSIDRTELYLADEIFLCGSSVEIAPVVSVDGFTIGKGAPGSVTLKLLTCYLAVTSGEDSAHPEWRTAVIS